MSNPYEPYGQQQPGYPQSGQLPQQPGYPQSGQLPQQPGYGQPVAVVMAPMTKTSGLAIGSLICSLIGIITFGAGAIPGVILGHLGLNAIKKSNGSLTGRGMAMTGLIIGYIEIGLGVLGCCAYFLFFGSLFAALGSSTGGLQFPLF